MTWQSFQAFHNTVHPSPSLCPTYYIIARQEARGSHTHHWPVVNAKRETIPPWKCISVWTLPFISICQNASFPGKVWISRTRSSLLFSQSPDRYLVTAQLWDFIDFLHFTVGNQMFPIINKSAWHAVARYGQHQNSLNKLTKHSWTTSQMVQCSLYNQRPKSSALYRVIGCHLGIRHTVGQSETSIVSCSLGCHGYNYMSNAHELASVMNSYCHAGHT